ncbi:CBM_collapsed_G0029640.mRNA.1.CDS.1 [Saccharomyces cerevisiae]|nr:CBM_collapsed_G0029640.mRNA.1.CDS.1 [Saccharomyces cerevisiae]
MILQQQIREYESHRRCHLWYYGGILSRELVFKHATGGNQDYADAVTEAIDSSPGFDWDWLHYHLGAHSAGCYLRLTMSDPIPI